MPGKEYGLKKTKKYKELKNNSTSFIDGNEGSIRPKLQKLQKLKPVFLQGIKLEPRSNYPIVFTLWLSMVSPSKIK